MSSNLIRKTIYIFLLVLPAIYSTAGSGQREKLKEATDHYLSGNYQQALSIWRAEYAAGNADAGLLYNIGNAESMLGNTAEAIMAYEKAHRFKPADTDISKALQSQRSNIQSGLQPVESFFLIRWAQVLLSFFRPAVWVFIAIIFLFIALLKWLGTLRAVKLNLAFIKGNVLTYFIIGFVLLLTGVFSYLTLYRLNEGIVFSDCEFRQGPSVQSPLLKELKEGEKVKITDHLSGWKKVNLENLDEGWVKEECIEIIDLHNSAR